jgi:hypothetical protein
VYANNAISQQINKPLKICNQGIEELKAAFNPLFFIAKAIAKREKKKNLTLIIWATSSVSVKCLVIASWQANNKVAITSNKIPFAGCSVLVIFEALILFLVQLQ